MAEPTRKARRVLSEESKKRKREHDRTRARTRINIGPPYTQWRELREEKGFKTDGDLAMMLLHFYSSSALGNKQSAEPRPQDDLHQAVLVSGGLSDSATVRRSNIPGGGGGGGGGDATVWRSGNTGEEEFTSSLSVGDGCFMVDLANPSELLVDEECLLQLFQSCRRCNSQCDVGKTVQGLKVAVSQECRSCGSSHQWSNL
ncbi:zinc finger protein 692-like isoform X1 [Nelusetta ayraudi]|uniref:zinc finger protein 692-like isoform X1 n=1 Tax=Nelusetta ayraudi TaxID=303726 RepID=UPI003F7022EC